MEQLPPDELPRGVPADARSESPGDRAEGGRFARGNALARSGGAARRGKTRLATRMGLAALPASAAFRPYRASAAAFRRAQCTEVARTVGGGVCGPGPSSLIASAALQLAWSRFLFDLAAEKGDAELALRASRLAAESKQSLLAAHELAAREAHGRAAASASDDPAADFYAEAALLAGGERT